MRNLNQNSEEAGGGFPIDVQTIQEFSDVNAAKEFTTKNKEKFDTVTLIKELDGQQERIEHYLWGQKDKGLCKIICVN